MRDIPPVTGRRLVILIKLVQLIAITMWALLWSMTGIAQTQLERASQSLDITASIGFQQQVQLDKWTPITITVRNAGAAVTGYLEIIAADSRDRIDYKTHYRQPLELAKGARKRLQFTIYISRIAEPLRIRVVTAAGEVASYGVELLSRLSQQRFIVALANDVNLDYLNDRKNHSVRVVYPLAGFLPVHWQGYDGVEAVVLHRQALNTLAPRQYLALQKWISSGGTLLVSGGYDTAILRTSRIAQLLPARVTGTQQLDTGNALHTALGDEDNPLILTKPLGIASVYNATEQTVYRINNVPLVLKHKYGRGSVVLLTFDLADKPFHTWAGMRQFMYRLLQLSAVKPVMLQDRQSGDNAASQILNRLTRHRAIDYPGHTTVIAFSAFYLVVLALYSFQSNTRHSSNSPHVFNGNTLLAYTVPVVFSLGAIGLFHHLLFPQSPSLASVAVIEPFDNSTLAQIQLELGLHSTRDQPLGISYSGASPLLRAAASPLPGNRPITIDQEATVATWVFDQGATTGAQPLDAFPYTVFSAYGRDIIDFAVSAGYQADATLEFHNTSGRAITDLWAFSRDNVFELGAIADGQSVALDLSSGMPRERLNWRHRLRDAHSGSRVPVVAVDSILDGDFGARFNQDSDTSVLLVGFTGNPWVTLTGSKIDHVNLTMMVWRIQQRRTLP